MERKEIFECLGLWKFPSFLKKIQPKYQNIFLFNFSCGYLMNSFLKALKYSFKISFITRFRNFPLAFFLVI